MFMYMMYEYRITAAISQGQQNLCTHDGGAKVLAERRGQQFKYHDFSMSFTQTFFRVRCESQV